MSANLTYLGPTPGKSCTHRHLLRFRYLQRHQEKLQKPCETLSIAWPSTVSRPTWSPFRGSLRVSKPCCHCGAGCDGQRKEIRGMESSGSDANDFSQCICLELSEAIIAGEAISILSPVTPSNAQCPSEVLTCTKSAGSSISFC